MIAPVPAASPAPAPTLRSVFLVPVFDQAAQLPALLAEFAAAPLPCDTLLLVDDGSTDGSSEIVRASGHPSLRFERNHGVGHAMIRAAEWALERGYDFIGGIASNGKMVPAEMGRLLAPLLAGDADYVKGSRFLVPGTHPNLPAFRRRAIPLVNRFVRAITGRPVTDATCGYRAYRLDILRRAEFDWRAEWLHTYSFEYYLDAQVAISRHIRFREVPVTMRYPATRRDYTKIRPGRDWLAMLRPWVRARLDGPRIAPLPPLLATSPATPAPAAPQLSSNHSAALGRSSRAMSAPLRYEFDPRSILARYLESQLLIELGAEIGPETNLFEAGVLDSFGLIELVKFIEKEFSISITDDEIASPALASLAGMAELVARKQEELDLA